MSTLKERAVLMRLSIGLPGEARQDSELTSKVKSDHALGDKSGRWVKALYPTEALEPIKKLDNEARAYHARVTLPFDNGIGILPAALIMEHGDKMREYMSRREYLVESHFLARYQDWIAWAKANHNGSFDASQYPPVDDMREKFYFRTEPLPVPDSEHFSTNVASLLGTDLDSVNNRVADAATEAQRELMRRISEPVAAMARKLSEVPKEGKDCPTFRDTLVGNLKDIVELAPKLNLTGDAAIAEMIREAEALTVYDPQALRDSSQIRSDVAAKATTIMKRLEGYKL